MVGLIDTGVNGGYNGYGRMVDRMDTGGMMDRMDTGVNGGSNGYGSEWWI